MDWLQVGAFFVAVLSLGLAGLVYVTRQFNRMGDRMTRLDERMGSLEQGQVRVEERLDRMDERMTRLEERMDERMTRFEERIDRRLNQMQGEIKGLGEGLQNVEKEQARMLGFLEGRGVMGKAPADAEPVS